MSFWRAFRDLHAEEHCKDYDQALNVLEEDYRATDTLACWRTEFVAVAKIDRYQIIDDPDDFSGWQKVGELREALRQECLLPPVVLAHTAPDDRGSYGLLDGRHRFNAAHLEGSAYVRAWVAHVGCCGGPAANR
ncbi:ParB/RepB/Spo0J family partition protein [Streptomyces griseoaurantiacus]|uniref:ParB/RepB/Spo0J family partition protein n=1 Tax=Streptomyces griseoaurantiacus TaxID=68213 RepID=UPI003868B9AF